MGLPPELQQHLGALRKAEEVFVKPLMGVLASLDYITQTYGRIAQVEEQKVKVERELTDAQEKLREYREQIEKFPAILRQKREEFNGQVAQARVEADKERAAIRHVTDSVKRELLERRDHLAATLREQTQAEAKLARAREELSKIAQMAG